MLALLPRTFIQKSSLRRMAFKLAENVFGEEVSRALARRYFGYHSTIDVEKAGRVHAARHPEARVLSRERILPALFACYYDQEADPNLILPAPDVPSACSYVPYYRGHTDLLIFNFLKQNYGIRDPVLIRFSIFKGHEAVWTHQRVMPGDHVFVWRDAFIDTGGVEVPERGTVAVEVFHPSLPRLGQFRYFGLYRDEPGGVVSGVHSMPVPKNKLVRSNQPTWRCFGPSDSSLYYGSAKDAPVPLRPQEQTNGYLTRFSVAPAISVPGYITLMGKEAAPHAIWHDGPEAHFVRELRPPLVSGPCLQAFYVPDFQEHAPYVLASHSQIGFKPDTITFRATDEQGRVLATRVAVIRTADDTVDLAALFRDDHLLGPVVIIADFNKDAGAFEKTPVCYLHLYYRSRGQFGDQVHSFNTTGRWNDPLPASKSYRCRKFAPLLKDDTLCFLYSIVNIGGTGPNRDDTVKVRLLTDRGGEFVVLHTIVPDGISIIKGDMLLELAGTAIDTGAVVQIEHETTNYNASWFALDRRTKHVGVDHFTGG